MISKKLNNLLDDIKSICFTHRCDKWSNSWQFNNGNQTPISKIQNFFLTHIEHDGTIHYQDIEGLSIEIQYVQDYRSKEYYYRIDIKERKYDIHNFWLFDDKDFILVETYVKELVYHQYQKIEKFYQLINLSKGAYMEKQPEKMYHIMNIKLRGEKLKKINDESSLY